ncbi:hypothetical protein RPATATE_1363 [Rickettsia parkeri str. Tate's Hell]|uniref:Uncharacterized protein n=2 Tax=Rickettsia parkeri TaxID=35792 RepID=A0ABR5DPP6_RICPA|nr:hypothetical protein RPAAT24_1159 [Rickettsia parkeri str. AT\
MKMNVKDLEDLILYFTKFFNELSHTENIDVAKIEKLFNRTIQESINTLSEALEKAYQEQLKNKRYLFI